MHCGDSGSDAMNATGQTISPEVNKDAQHRSYWLLLGDYLFYLGVWIFAVVRRHDVVSAIASAVALPCFVLWFVAKWQLGTSFTISAQARKLVTTGLYARFRHPIYLIGGIAIIATAVCLRWWPFTLLVVAGNLYQFVRIRREEKVLAEKFGGEYEDYRRKTWF